MGGLFGGGKQPQSQKQTPAGALQVQTSVFGSAVPLAYGKNRATMNLIHYFNWRAIAHVEQQQTGGKGGSKKSTNTTYTYTVAFMGGLAVGGIQGVGTVWKNKEKHTLASLGLTLFTGGAGQTVWPTLAASRPSENFPYANLAWVGAPAFDLGDSTSLPNFTFELKGLCPYNPGVIDDALASDIVVDYLTNARHGAGFGTYLANLDNGPASFRKYCLARGLFISPIENNQRQAGAFLKEIAEICNSALVWRNGKLDIIPYGDTTITGNGATYTPNLTPLYDLTPDDFMYEKGQPPIRFKEKPSEQQYNHHRIEYKSRSNDYNPMVVELKDQADIDDNGLKTKAVTKYDAITLDPLARDVLQLQQQRDLHVKGAFSFRVGIRHSLLEPMDFVTISDISNDPLVPNLGLDRKLVRIIDTVEQDDALDIIAEPVDVGVAHAPLYDTQGPLGYNQDFNVDPGVVTDPLIMNAPGLLTKSGYEQWIAVAGQDADYGGCFVWVSDDNVTYRKAGPVYGSAHYGAIVTSAMPAGATTDDTASVCRVQLYTGKLLAATQSDRDNWRSILYIGGEWVSYRDAVLVSGTTYDLQNFKRAGYGSANTSHAVGQGVARMDEAIFKLPYDEGNIGKTVWFKFQAFNVYGGGLQDLSTCVAYSHVLGASEKTAPMKYVPLAGVGQNLMWQEHTFFHDATLPFMTQSGTLTQSYDATVSLVGSLGSLKCVVNDPAGNISSSWFYLGGSATYSVPLEAGKKYIISGYFRHNLSAAGVMVGMSIKNSAGVIIPGASNTDIGPAGAWKRVSMVVDLTANNYEEGIALVYLNRAGKTVPYSVWVDKLMVEEMVGLLGAPSTWTPGSAVNLVVAAQSAAAAAQGAADSAAADAAASLGQLSDIASDSKLTPNEKLKARAQYNELIAEEAGIVAKAEQMGVDRYANDYAASVDALIAYLKTVANGLGTGNLVDASNNWVSITGTSTIVRTTWDQKWKDVYVDRQTVMNAIADSQIAGDDIVVNGSFESRLDPRCVTGGFGLAAGAMLADGWVVESGSQSAAWNVISDVNTGRIRSGTRGLAFGLGTAVTLNPAGTAYVVVTNEKKIAVKPGDRFRVRAMVQETFSNALNSGMLRQIFCGLRCYNAAGAAFANVGLDYTSTGPSRVPGPGTSNTVQQENIVTIPANTAYVRVECYAYVKNNNAVAIVPNNSCVIAAFDDIEIMRWLGGHELTEAGSGQQIGDLRNVNPAGHANVGSAWTAGAVTYTSSSTSATISFSASNLRLAGVNIAYNAASVVVAGSASTSVTYLLYFDDPTYAGGARTLAATTTYATLINAPGRVYVGQVTVNFPAAGGSGGGGGVTPCVRIDAYVPEGDGHRRMGHVKAGELIRSFDPRDMHNDLPAMVFSSEHKLAECVDIVCENGAVLPCSVYAEVWTDRGLRLAPSLLGRKLWTEVHGKKEWSLVVDIVATGVHMVNHVVAELEGQHDVTGMFYAGKEPGVYVGGHHNIKNTP